MSDNTQVAQIPAHIMARIQARQGAKSALLDAVVSGASYPKISIRAARFRLIDDGVETMVGTELDVVFVAVNPRVSKIYYDKPFTGDTDDKTPPACFSDDGINPDSSVTTPVNPDCATCAKNVRGSRVTPSGANSKACGDVRYVGVVCAADPTKVYGLTIPVSAMKAFRVYFKELSQFGLVPEEVITTLGFDAEASFPKITFKHKGYVPEKHLASLASLGVSTEAAQVIRLTNTTPALPSARPPAAPSKPIAAETPPPVKEKVVAAVEDKEVVVPIASAKQGGKAAQAAAPTTDAATALEKQIDDLFA